MMGSGIYSETVTREIVCAEMCWDCDEDKTTCKAVWEEDMETDDWGNLEIKIHCKECDHSYTYKEERE